MLRIMDCVYRADIADPILLHTLLNFILCRGYLSVFQLPTKLTGMRRIPRKPRENRGVEHKCCTIRDVTDDVQSHSYAPSVGS